MSANLRANLLAAEAKLAQLNASTLRSLPDRVARCLRAIAALERGDRAGVLAEAAALRASGSDGDLAEILDFAAESPKGRMTASGPIPGLFAALKSWRLGKKPRGSAALRRLAAERPALGVLLSVLGRRRSLTWDLRALSRLSPRLPLVTVLAHELSLPRPSRELTERFIDQLGPTPTLDLSRYFGAGPEAEADPSAALHAWAADVTIPWTGTLATALTAISDQTQAGAALANLLRGVQRRISSGIVRGVDQALTVAPLLAKRARSDRRLIANIDVLQRRLGALLDPHHNLPTLLTLWRRSLGRPAATRLVIAEKIVKTLRSMLVADEPPPPELPFAIEALLYIFSTAADVDEQINLVREFGMLLPPSAIASLVARTDPTTRFHIAGLYALSQGYPDKALDPIVSLAEAGAFVPASNLLMEFIVATMEDSLDGHDPDHRRFDRAVKALNAQPSLRLDPLTLPMLLHVASICDLRREPIEALVRRQLLEPVADGDPRVAGQLCACILLGDEARLQELVREIGRWLRRQPRPDAADDVAFEILAQVYRDLDSFDETLVHRALSPLSSFLLRDGSQRAFRAATRIGAKAQRIATGCGRWALEHIDRLDTPDLWGSFLDLAQPRHRLQELMEIFEQSEQLPF